MSIAYQLYSYLIPEGLKQFTDPLQLRFHEWKKTWALQIMKQRLSSRSNCRKRRKKLHDMLRRGTPIKVAFQVAQLGKWKCESVFQQMLQDPHFIPMIWCVPVSGDLHITNLAEHEREQGLIISFFTKRGIPVYTYPTIDAFPAEQRPELIFIHEAYDYIFFKESFRGLQEELLCHVPYCFHNTNNVKSYDGIGNNCCVLDFLENESYCRFLSLHGTHRGRNSVVTGTPMADIFMAKEARTEQVWKDCGKNLKRVIWAPHWTITADTCWNTFGTFLKTAQSMLELAQEHREDIQFAFKPHPHLYRTLCKLPEWGKEKTDTFYRMWREMPNTQLEEGPYTALFMQSDAMIHDSGSFVMEYLFADKPCMFLRENGGYGDYNEQSLDCLKAYQYGLTKAEIEDFLQHCVLGTEDPLRDVRATMRRRHLLPPHDKTAAQNIIDAIYQV